MKLHALAITGLLALAPAALAQDCSTKTSCDSKAELASAQEGSCSSQKAKSECSGEAELAKAQDCAAKTECSGEAELAKAQDCATKCSSDGELAKAQDCGSKQACSTGELASAEGDCATKSSCSGELAAAEGECSKPEMFPAKAQLATLIRSDRVAGIVVDGKAYLGSKAVAKIECLMSSHLATEIKAVCENSRACEAFRGGAT